MKKTFTRVLLLMLIVMLIGSLAISASAADYSDHDEALGYLESYDENVGSDPSFADNIAQALATVRQSISTYATIWALLPPIIAIALALISKEVYFSLFVGILSGALIYSNFNPWGMVTNTFDVMIGKLSDGWNHDLPGDPGHDGRPYQQSRWLRRLRPLGKQAHQEPCGCHDLHRGLRYADLCG